MGGGGYILAGGWCWWVVVDGGSLTQLELKKENLGSLEGSFLDLAITIKDKKICTKLFNKR